MRFGIGRRGAPRARAGGAGQNSSAIVNGVGGDYPRIGAVLFGSHIYAPFSRRHQTDRQAQPHTFLGPSQLSDISARRQAAAIRPTSQSACPVAGQGCLEVLALALDVLQEPVPRDHSCPASLAAAVWLSRAHERQPATWRCSCLGSCSQYKIYAARQSSTASAHHLKGLSSQR